MSLGGKSGREPDRDATRVPSRKNRRFRHGLEYALLRFLLLILSGLDDSGSARLGRVLGWFAFAVLRIRRRVTLDNLAHAFPERSDKERERIARDAYSHFGVMFLELVRLPRLSKEDLIDRTKIDKIAIFDRAREGGRGAVLLTGHIGNWEMVGSGVAARGYPLSATVARQRNAKVDEYVTWARESAGIHVLKVDEGLRPILRELKENRFVAFLSDQDAGRRGIFIPFLGRLASTPIGPARFARMAKCPIVPGYAIRLPDGRYRLELPGTVYVREDLPPREAEIDATRRTVELLEAQIRRHPEQWFWMHRRWKTRPPD